MIQHLNNEYKRTMLCQPGNARYHILLSAEICSQFVSCSCSTRCIHQSALILPLLPLADNPQVVATGTNVTCTQIYKRHVDFIPFCTAQVTQLHMWTCMPSKTQTDVLMQMGRLVQGQQNGNTPSQLLHRARAIHGSLHNSGCSTWLQMVQIH